MYSSKKVFMDLEFWTLISLDSSGQIWWQRLGLFTTCLIPPEATVSVIAISFSANFQEAAQLRPATEFCCIPLMQ
jgi:hypothetical protein